MKPIRRIGILQPVYLPWLGYFEQMQKVDHFVFQNDVQYTRPDWRNRNRIKSSTGPLWLTVPTIKATLDTAIDQIEISHRSNWPRKHLESIRTNYARLPAVHEIRELLEHILSKRHTLLADMTIETVISLASELGIETPVSKSRNIKRGENSCLQKRVVEIAQAHDATHLYLGAKAREYMLPDFFAPYGITLEFQDYIHPVYPQKYGEFLSHMSAIDFLINVPREARGAYFTSRGPL